MKLRVFVITTAVALAAPLAAPAASFEFGGHVSGGGKVQFTLVKRSKTNIFVRGLRFRQVTATCNGNPNSRLNLRLRGKIPVDRRREFRAFGESSDGLNHSRVSGKFRRTWRRASGTVRIYGVFDGMQCSTGLEEWTAKRGG